MLSAMADYKSSRIREPFEMDTKRLGGAVFDAVLKVLLHKDVVSLI
jgi:hypothetical protein